MSSANICRILEAAARLNVASLKIEAIGLDVEFHAPAPPKHEYVIDMSEPDVPLEEPVEPGEVYTSAPNATHSPPDSGESVVLDDVPRDPKEIADEQELEELQITDPLEYEERIARGELVDVESQDD